MCWQCLTHNRRAINTTENRRPGENHGGALAGKKELRGGRRENPIQGAYANARVRRKEVSFRPKVPSMRSNAPSPLKVRLSFLSLGSTP